MTDTNICPLPHYRDPEKPRRTMTGSKVCGGHYTALERHLTEAPLLDLDLLEAHTGTTTVGEKVRSSTTPGLNLRDDVTVARTFLHTALRMWALHVADNHNFRVRQPDDNVPNLAGILTTHLRWLANQDNVDQLHWDLTTAIRGGRRIVAPTGARTVILGQCVEDYACDTVTRDGLPCTGTLQVTLYPEDPSLPSPHLIVCTDCPAEYLPKTWLKLGKRVTERQAANA